VTDEGRCVTDGSGQYGTYEDCVFTYSGSQVLQREEFGLEYDYSCAYDWLEVNKKKYCGSTIDATAFPSTMALGTTGATFTYHSDSSSNGIGFKICEPTTVVPVKPSKSTGMNEMK